MIRNALKSADFPQFSDRYDTGALRHSGTPSAHNGMLILVLLHSQFLHAVLGVGKVVSQQSGLRFSVRSFGCALFYFIERRKTNEKVNRYALGTCVVPVPVRLWRFGESESF